MARLPPSLHPSESWLAIVDQLIEGSPTERRKAREILWQQVEEYVVKVARLPMGPLNEQDDARRAVALAVLQRLEQDQYRHVKAWRERQRLQRDNAAWWNWINVLARRAGVDVARSSDENLAPRGKPFQWVRVIPTDPLILAEFRGGRVLEYIMSCDDEQLRAHLTEFQAALATRNVAEAPEPSD